MAEFIASIPLSAFKALKADEIKRLKSCELTCDGEYVCTVVIPQTDYIRLHTEQLAQLGNCVRGESLEDILKGEKVES